MHVGRVPIELYDSTISIGLFNTLAQLMVYSIESKSSSNCNLLFILSQGFGKINCP